MSEAENIELAPLYQQQPPQNIDAERCVLGCMLMDEEARAKVFDYLTRDSFVLPAHRVIFAQIRTMYEQKMPVDTITVYAALEKDQAFISAGGAAYLAELSEAVPTTDNVESYAEIVRDKALLRQLIGTCRHIIKESQEGERAGHELVSEAEQAMVTMIKERTKGFSPISRLIMPSIEGLEQMSKNRRNGATVSGIDTGFTDLNNMTSGFHGGELIIVAARPSMGKTAFALNLAENIAEKNKATVAFFSMEMGPDELIRRLLSSRARIDGQKMRRGDLASSDYMKLVTAGGVLKDLELFIDSSPTLTPVDIKSRCQRLRSEKPNLSAVFIDYIQLLSAGSDNRFKDNRVQEISYISRALKSLAVDLNVPVVALSQLNRQADQGTEKGGRPQLSHLRESGSIEQDADVVMMLYRPSYYDKEAQPNEAEVIIAKQRNGPTGTVKMIFHTSFARFENGVAGA